jgi:hypothetical protein
MKGGKDMTKTYTMYNKSDKYTINNETGEVFEIPKSTLSVDGKKLYDALFLNFEKGDSIKIDKDSSFDNANDKLSNAVYNNIVEVIDKIVIGINSFEEENVETNV